VRRPLLLTLAGTLLALVLLFAFSAWLLSRNLGEARVQSEERMTGLASYIAEHLREDVLSYPFALQPPLFPAAYAEEQGRWLERLTRATGLERAVITDSAGYVYASSHNLIGSGEEIRPYLVDTALFAAAARDGGARSTPLAEIEGVHFQSLYHPFTLRDKRHLIVLETDQNFMASVEAYRTYLALASLFLLAVFAVLAAGLLALDRKVQAALAESRRNERLAFLGRTSAELAHEIRNPLGIIKSSIDVLRRRYDPERAQQAFDFVSEEVMRLSRLIGNILGLSRDMPLEEKPFLPAEVLAALATAHAQDFPDVGFEIRLPEGLTLIGDRDVFRQVADNLARNASAAMGGKGSFTVSSEPGAGRGLRLLFSDTGPGLPKDVRARLFEPFVSGSKAGTGLGLSIVRSLCERAGWAVRLHADAADGAGAARTCFAVEIPRARVASPGGTED
jgi:signal transduction histidine kinase